MSSLYTLASEYAAAAERLAEMDVDEQTVLDTLDGLSGELQVKSLNIAQWSLNLDALAAAIKGREEAMAARRRAAENLSKRLREYVRDCMDRAQIQRIETPEVRLTVQANPPAVVIDMASAVPDEFLRIPPPPPPELDKAAIKAAIKAGREVPGVHLEQTRRLVIR